MLAQIEKLQEQIKPLTEPLTNEELAEWRAHPVTQAFMRTAIVDYLANVSFLSENIPCDESSRVNTAIMRGENIVLENFLNYNLGDANSEFE